MNTQTALPSHVFDATAATFEQDVILKSKEVPVLVDFWATWCGPCKSLGPILEKLADDYGGGFLLAKVDVDQEQELASYFQIRSVPTVMLLKDAQVLGGFPGALPEGQIRQFLEQHGVVAVEGSAPEAGEPEPVAALDVGSLRAAASAEPDNHQARLELALGLVETGELTEAGTLLDALPAELRSDPRAARAASRVRFEQAVAGAPAPQELERTIAANPDDPQARYQLGASLILGGAAEAGLEHLLELLRKNKDPEGLPRQALLDGFNLVEDPDLVRAFRRRMTALLY